MAGTCMITEMRLMVQRDASYHSNWADLGGFLCGLLPAVLFLPCPSDARCPDHPLHMLRCACQACYPA